MASSKRRRFGWVRKLPSGRWQASYLDPEGCRQLAPNTFRTRAEADRWLSLVEAELARGQWKPPHRENVTVDAFGARWIDERPGLRPRTVDLYRWLFKKYVQPNLGKVKLGSLDAARVRRWRHDLLMAGVSATMTAKAYRLLRAILMTAVDDDLISRNPCRIRGAGSEPTPERPTLTAEQALDLAALVPIRFRALVLLATFGSLRWGEVTALRESDVDLVAGVVKVRAAFAERSTGELVLGPPKSRAGVRSVTLPRPVVESLQRHLSEHSVDGENPLIFTNERGGPLRRSNFNRQAGWVAAVESVGVPGLHFHDLRHTGNTLAASTGASLRDLMNRMGHDSMRAALIYQHATQEADAKIALGLSDCIEAARPAPTDGAEQAAGEDDGGAGDVLTGAAT